MHSTDEFDLDIRLDEPPTLRPWSGPQHTSGPIGCEDSHDATCGVCNTHGWTCN
ncbi:hypothetical protein [Fodinicola acaciae]|uniref:hypothetical protein n=1 Tax=Fodinicola acaciae TaxID=2681555 RepID=UPI0013D4A342|nr:hypothetical protein [Fodinicola acaciae]